MIESERMFPVVQWCSKGAMISSFSEGAKMQAADDAFVSVKFSRSFV
jgi:hypothetical protein